MAEGKTTKLVDETMCKSCIFENVYDAEEPCHTCQETPVNENSVHPINYIAKGDKK